MVIQACLCLLAGAYALQLSSFARDSDRAAVTLLAASVILVLRRPLAAAALISGLVLFVSAAIAVIDGRLDPRFAGDSLLTELEIVDESADHEGHAGAWPGGETHFRLHVVSAAFAGLGRLERQRLVHRLLAEELAGPVHALSVSAKAPDEG